MIKQAIAIAKKEIKLSLRFKYDYFFSTLITPIKFLIFFAIVYAGFFATGATGIGGIEKENYFLFLLFGSLIHSIMSSGFFLFQGNFLSEKYWKTIQALLIAPVKKINLIVGTGLSELFKNSIIISVLFIIAFILMRISFLNLLIVFVTLLLLMLGIIGFGLIPGTFALSNENFLFLFKYFLWAWGFLSCFYYPIEALPSIIKPLVLLNPVYHGLYIIRELWINGSVNNFFLHFLIVLNFAIIMPLISIIIFNKVIKKYGISGY